MAERLKAPLSKSGIPPKVGSWVRIPPSPPLPVCFSTRGWRIWRLPPSGKWPDQRRSFKSASCGEMSELAEGARLEIVCVVYSGTEGSNPSLSATSAFTPHRIVVVSFCLTAEAAFPHRHMRDHGLPPGRPWDKLRRPSGMCAYRNGESWRSMPAADAGCHWRRLMQVSTARACGLPQH